MSRTTSLTYVQTTPAAADNKWKYKNSKTEINTVRTRTRSRRSRANSVARVVVKPLEYSNAAEFDSIRDASVLLFYTQTIDSDVVFDPQNDAALASYFTNPFQFDNRSMLDNFVALVMRARYELKPHPNAESIVASVSAEWNVPTNQLLVMVYQRDSARSSAVENRRSSPFLNGVNGLSSAGNQSEPLWLFSQYSHEPVARVTLIWHSAVRTNATVGHVAFRVEQLY